MTLRPVEWDVLHPLDGQPLAIIRLVYLGARREPYYRAVTANPDRAERKLIGYWATSVTRTPHASRSTSTRPGRASEVVDGRRACGRRRRSHRQSLMNQGGRQHRSGTPRVARLTAWKSGSPQSALALRSSAG